MDKTLNLRLFRKRNGLTQNAVAEYLGVSKVFISYVESGRSALPEDKFQQIINNDRGWVVEDSFLVATTLTAPSSTTSGESNPSRISRRRTANLKTL